MSLSNKLAGYGIKGARFGSFGAASPEGFDRILPINLIIGRNNAGKSSLVDMLEYACSTREKRARSAPVLQFSRLITRKDVERVFATNASGGSIPGNHFDYAQPIVGRLMTWALDGKTTRFVSVEPAFDLRGMQQKLADHQESPLAEVAFRRIGAERDIVPEELTKGIALSSDGRGATNAVARFLTGDDLDATYARQNILSDLNEIVAPDIEFTDISVHQSFESEPSRWEIYLHEAEKGRVPLSRSGSGLKVLLLVLICFRLLPRAGEQPVGNTIYAFEELENNLHPSLLRRLLRYLRGQAEAHGCVILLTTHPSVPIDLFATDPLAQILHVRHNGQRSVVTAAVTHRERTSVLTDLDIRPSDILQSNGVVWVEGPSDRLYLRRWIDIWSDGQLQEGWHYQILFYGGRLLSHLSCATPEEVTEAIRVMLLNRNFAVVIDSDRRNASADINATKRRIVDESQKAEAIAWVTAGREIENYIPPDNLDSLYPGSGKSLRNRFNSVWSAIDKAQNRAGERAKRDKVGLAHAVVEGLTKDGLRRSLDLGTKLDELCAAIRRWNGL